MTFKQFMADRVIACKSAECKEDLQAAYDAGLEEGLMQRDNWDEDDWEDDDWDFDNWDDDDDLEEDFEYIV